MMLMFTSGTTGNPKAVVISHGAYMSRARRMHGIELNADDVLYICLSLTHINAQGTLRIGLTAGLPVVITRKFSKRHLWSILPQVRLTTDIVTAMDERGILPVAVLSGKLNFPGRVHPQLRQDFSHLLARTQQTQPMLGMAGLPKVVLGRKSVFARLRPKQPHH
jgi:hypothetical protein